MTEVKSMGISKTMFIVGLITAILASSLISAVVMTARASVCSSRSKLHKLLKVNQA
jgi:hypothetical protein